MILEFAGGLGEEERTNSMLCRNNSRHLKRPCCHFSILSDASLYHPKKVSSMQLLAVADQTKKSYHMFIECSMPGCPPAS
jgi:hypothetical protein